ncbi:MAG: SLC13 family permease [Rhodospirillaceae bacterium]|nr:SLC13 family permease [Rhodospirillaceae bacterium]MBT6117524.1 SLC13 family permease [Rhodospirillaceae bacterium]
MALTMAVIVGALVAYSLEKTSIEITSLGVLCVFLLLFQIVPVRGPDGFNLLGPDRLLAGFASPALITVLALLVVGQGLVGGGVLDYAVRGVLVLGRNRHWLTVLLALGCVAVVSAFLNNIPVVVIFIPIIQAIAQRLRESPSRYMMALSYAGIFGGMTTLIGSSTNLLVSDELRALGREPFHFFDFSIPGVVMAAVGLTYVLLVVPRLMPDRATIKGAVVGRSGKQFIAQISIPTESGLVGQSAVGGFFPAFKDMTVRLVLRGEHAYLPPFEGIEFRAGDLVIVAATRQVLTEIIQRGLAVVVPDLRDGREMPDPAELGERRGRAASRRQVLAEVMVAPNSRLLGLNLEQTGFRYRHHCIVLAMERRARMVRSRITEVPLEAGDVLLIQGEPADVTALRDNRDVVLMEWSSEELPSRRLARIAGLVFFGIIAAAGTGLVPIVVAAVIGALAMIAAGALTLSQASRAMDPSIILSIAAALAMGAAMQETGAANLIVDFALSTVGGLGPAGMLSAFFLTVALTSNAISTKACAVLFTPIAVGIADALAVPVAPFAVAVIFASNCAFASPIGYQTNLLVMGPGHYRFADFVRAGLPLIVLIWLAFSLFAPIFYGLV